MTTDTPKPATLDELMAATGLGRNQVFRLVRAGRIPGAIVNGRLVVTRDQFHRLLSEGIAPPKHMPAPTDFLKRKAS